MNAEVLRSLVLDRLKAEPNTQWVNLELAVAELAKSRGIISGDSNERARMQQALAEVVWAMIVEGVIVPLARNGSQAWPFMRLTEYGQAVAGSAAPVPHDPHGFVAHMCKLAPDLKTDEVALLYVGEALDCFRSGNYLAAVAMLGVASEHAVNVMIDGLEHWVGEKEAKTLRSTEKWKIAIRFDEATRRIRPRLRMIPRSFSDDFDIHLTGIAALLRAYRNDAGHPSGRSFTRDEVYSMLNMMPHYLARIYGFASWLKSQAAGAGTQHASNQVEGSS